MDIGKGIGEKHKSIAYVIFIIIGILFAIKSLNLFYKKQEEIKKIEITQKEINQTTQSTVETEQITNSVENDSIKATMKSFVNYCNNREIENAYKMLTDECKNAIFPTEEYLKTTYIEKIYNVKKNYYMFKWCVDGNKTTYLVKLYEDILSTGGSNDNYTEDYYTFVKNDNGTYKININNYIYGEQRNIQKTINGITIKIGNVDVYEEYEKARITIINNSSKKICLNGNKNNRSIYLENVKGVKYSSINSNFDMEEIIMRPNEVKIFDVEFNKVYRSSDKAQYLIISDIILDYENYLVNKENYSYRTKLKVEYQK